MSTEKLRVSKDLKTGAHSVYNGLKVGSRIKGRIKDNSKVSSAPGRVNLSIFVMDMSANTGSMAGVGVAGGAVTY